MKKMSVEKWLEMFELYHMELLAGSIPASVTLERFIQREVGR